MAHRGNVVSGSRLVVASESFLSASVSCSSVSLIDLCSHGKSKTGISVEIIRLLLEEKVRVGGCGGRERRWRKGSRLSL